MAHSLGLAPVRGALPFCLAPLPPSPFTLHLFPSPWTPLGQAVAWPAEGPVGPEMWHCQGGERPTGRGALQVYPVLKENKIFSWETFPLCPLLPPSPSVPFSWVVFRVQLRVLSGTPTPRPSPGCRWVWPCLGPRLYGGWHTPARHLCSLHLALMGRGRVRGWPSGRRSTGESHWLVSQLCLLAVLAQPQVCSPSSRHTPGLSALACLPQLYFAQALLLPTPGEDQSGGG